MMPSNKKQREANTHVCHESPGDSFGARWRCEGALVAGIAACHLR